MFFDSPGVAMLASQPSLAGLRDRLAFVSALLRAALGRRGVAFASAAALVGLLCSIGAFADLALSLRTADVTHQRLKSRGILDLDQQSRMLIRGLVARAAGAPTQAADPESLLQAWTRMEGALATFCDGESSTAPDIAGAIEICTAGAALHERLPRELARLGPLDRTIALDVMTDVMSLGARLNETNLAEAREADALAGRVVGHYGLSLAVLAISTCGFVAAGLVLIILIGRTSVLFHAQWRDARQARDSLKETIEAMPAGVVLYDANERLVLFNSAATVASPLLKQGNVIGKTYEQIAREAATKFARPGESREGTAEGWIGRFRSKGGVEVRQADDGRWFEWREVATRSGATVGLRLDVTEFKEAKQIAEEARWQYETLVDSLIDTVYKLDFRRGTITFASAAAARLFGVPPSALIGKPFLDYVLPEDRERLKDTVRAARYTADAVQHAQFRLVAADGTVKHVEDRFRRSVESGDAVVSGVLRDVSERVALSARLDEEMARLRSIVESSGALLMLTDAELNVEMVNREFEKFWDVPADEMVGRSLRETKPSTGLDPAQYDRWRAGSDRTPARFVRTRTDAQGRLRTLSITARPVADTRDILRQIVFLGVDDTERLEVEQTLFRSERLVTVGEMAATVAHEIAQPLQVIDLARAAAQEEIAQANEGNASLDSDYVRERLERIGQQIERANRIVSDLRNFVRGHGPEDVSLFSPVTALQSAINLTQHTFKPAGLVTTVTLTDPLPLVRGHISRLEQVLVNLINNAREAGAKTIELCGEKRPDGDGGSVYLAVVDDGPGISPDVLPRLFHEFVTTKPLGEGTGLGLRICRRIVEEMGGTITAANQPGGGARFEIRLPAVL